MGLYVRCPSLATPLPLQPNQITTRPLKNPISHAQSPGPALLVEPWQRTHHLDHPRTRLTLDSLERHFPTSNSMNEGPLTKINPSRPITLDHDEPIGYPLSTSFNPTSNQPHTRPISGPVAHGKTTREVQSVKIFNKSASVKLKQLTAKTSKHGQLLHDLIVQPSTVHDAFRSAHAPRSEGSYSYRLAMVNPALKGQLSWLRCVIPKAVSSLCLLPNLYQLRALHWTGSCCNSISSSHVPNTAKYSTRLTCQVTPNLTQLTTIQRSRECATDIRCSSSVAAPDLNIASTCTQSDLLSLMAQQAQT
ncbi:enoyl-CoA hydratase 2, peroxisomal-like [Dorcoceras hygrometricum]|uniref:Enoyl-CoA hydratase 2, peroxisomal-like n=1 Tax=Dorcoceras hygrometricum TaxID=472368 RepID=A0A2Z7D0A6_9LAMI|nr:enoyl-CoA hydratase 2, peroxisomal-like [Dorcoceras hygrometricum]